MRAATCFLAIASSAAAAAADLAHAEQLSTTDRVLVGPRLARTGDVVVAAWIEDPKALVLARLDGSGRVTERQEVALPEEDASIVDLAPVVRPDGSVSVFLLERGVRRMGQELPLKRVIVRHVGRRAPAIEPIARTTPEPVVQLVAEAPDDGSGNAPAGIVAAGLYTASRWPAVVWRREGGDAPETELAIVRTDEVTSSDILGESRVATAVAWRDDGGALVAASDAGRPVVMETASEAQIDVPTPAALTSLVAVGKADWIAAGLDAGRRLFVVEAEAHRAAQSYFHAVKPLVDAPEDLADAGAITGAPRLVRVTAGTAVLWTARVRGTDQVRMRGLDDEGLASRGSRMVLACAEGERALDMDALGVAGNVIVVATCAGDGRARVHGATVHCGLSADAGGAGASDACGIGPPTQAAAGEGSGGAETAGAAAEIGYLTYFGSLLPL